MPIVLVRVDDRLIHGQILEGWLPSTRAQELLVANDAVAQDDLRKMIMQSATPYSVGLVIDSVERIASLCMESDAPDVRRMIIVENPLDALRLKRAGVPFDSLNLGNFRTNDVTVCLSRSVAVGDETLRELRVIMEEGVHVSLQTVPYERPVDLFQVIRRCGRT
jgi:mannose/fructose/N-acetylgalactosamine-specific phosphotransferase system component IIB